MLRDTIPSNCFDQRCNHLSCYTNIYGTEINLLLKFTAISGKWITGSRLEYALILHENF